MTIKNLIVILVVASYMVVSGCSINEEAKVKFEDTTRTSSNMTEKKYDIQTLENSIEAHVSIIQLISNADKFHGKRVLLIGFVNIEFEGDAIYLHEDDYKHGITKNGLWLSLPEDFDGEDTRKIFDRKYVLIEGTFNAKRKGHMGLFSGAIEDITRFEVWVVPKADKLSSEQSEQE